MRTKLHIEYDFLDGRSSIVTLDDGENISKHLRGINFEILPNGLPPTATLALHLPQIEFLGDADAELKLTPEQVGVLTKFGWTPPA